MTYLLIAADPVEKQWTVIAQSEEYDEEMSAEIDKQDPSLRLVLNTNNFITFPTEEDGDA